ncbi:MAG: RluA family pseudouridine synthase [Leptospirales bacterium]
MPSDTGEPCREFLVARGEAPKRLDLYLSRNCLPFTRSRIQKLIDEGLVTLNDAPVNPSQKIRGGDLIRVLIPPPRPQGASPEPMDLDILYEDQDLLVLSKPPGLVVHPAPGHPTGTLVNGLLAHFRSRLVIETVEPGTPSDEEEGGVEPLLDRAGLIHRLDQDTSGVMVIGKSEEIISHLMSQFKDRTVSKQYLALVRGIPVKKRGEINAPIGRAQHDRKKFSVRADGKPSITRYRILQTFEENYSLLEVTLLTGRTHQIRVHFRHLGHPLLGDTVYGSRGKDTCSFPRQMLHAWKLAFTHPRTGQEMRFEAPIPKDFQEALNQLTPTPASSSPSM